MDSGPRRSSSDDVRPPAAMDRQHGLQDPAAPSWWETAGCFRRHGSSRLCCEMNGFMRCADHYGKRSNGKARADSLTFARGLSTPRGGCRVPKVLYSAGTRCQCAQLLRRRPLPGGRAQRRGHAQQLPSSAITRTAVKFYLLHTSSVHCGLCRWYGE